MLASQKLHISFRRDVYTHRSLTTFFCKYFLFNINEHFILVNSTLVALRADHSPIVNIYSIWYHFKPSIVVQTYKGLFTVSNMRCHAQAVLILAALSHVTIYPRFFLISWLITNTHPIQKLYSSCNKGFSEVYAVDFINSKLDYVKATKLSRIACDSVRFALAK